MLNYYRPVLDEKISHEKLIKLIKLIGLRYSHGYSLKKFSLFKIGLNKVKGEYKARYGKKVSYTAIKCFLNPNRKKLVTLLSEKPTIYAKIPYSSFLIFNTILDIIQSDAYLLKKCRLINSYTSLCFCKSGLIKDLSKVIMDYSGRIKKDSKKTNSKGLSDLINDFHKLSNKTCKEINIG